MKSLLCSGPDRATPKTFIYSRLPRARHSGLLWKGTAFVSFASFVLFKHLVIAENKCLGIWMKDSKRWISWTHLVMHSDFQLWVMRLWPTFNKTFLGISPSLLHLTYTSAQYIWNYRKSWHMKRDFIQDTKPWSLIVIFERYSLCVARTMKYLSSYCCTAMCDDLHDPFPF